MNHPLHTIALLITNPADRELLGEYLQGAGYGVCTGKPSEPLRETWDTVGLIIADEPAGRRHGKALVAFKRQPGMPFLPLLIALEERSDSTAWLRAGFDDVLCLPLSRRELAARLEVFLRLREQSMEQYRAAFEDAPIGIYRMAPDGRMRLANPALVHILGFTSFEELTQEIAKEGRSAAGHLHFMFEGRMEGERQRVGRESVWRRRDGTEVFVRENVREVLDEARTLLYYEGTVENITDRRRAEEALRLRTRQLEAVRAVTAEIIRELDLPTLLGLIHRRAAELVGATSGTIRLWDERNQMLVPAAWHGQGDWMLVTHLRLGEGVAGVAAARHEGMIVNDYRTSPHAIPPVLECSAISAVLAEPLLYRDRLLGAITVDKEGPGNPFTPQDRETLALFAAQAAIAIENARLYDAAQRELAERKRAEERLAARTRQLEAVRVLSAEITRELNLPTLLTLINQRAGELVGSSSGTIRLWDEQVQRLIPVAWHGFGENEEWIRTRRLRLGEGFSGAVAQRREGLCITDYRNSEYAEPVVLANTRITAALAEPLLYRDRLLGVITVDNEKTGQPFTDQDRETLALFATQAAIAIENARLFEERKRAEEARDRLLKRLISAEEDERARIARGLHDETAQSMTSLLLGLQAIEGSLIPEDVRARTGQLRSLVAKTLDEVHRLIDALRPSLLDDFGLVAALERSVKGYEAFEEATGVRVDFSAHGLDGIRLAPHVETTLYRIIQEALTNAIRHAEAKNVSVLLRRRGPSVVGLVEDDGRGFDLGAARTFLATNGNLGILGMEERAALVGGRLVVESKPGGGTTVVVEVPLGESREE